MKRAAVLGFPVHHSLSPLLHGWWLREYGVEGEYRALETDTEALGDRLKVLADQGYQGCNLTLPLKERVLEFIDIADDSVVVSGAANTLVFADGKIKGLNSDGFGFLESLKSQAPGWSGARIVLIGAGGAARSIASTLKAHARAFALINRDQKKARKLSEDLGLSAEIFDFDDRAHALPQASLLVNCTSLGMKGQPPLDIDLSRLPAHAVVCDIVYRPLQTPFLQAAAKRNLIAVEGLSMLLHQGRLGFRHWFGQDPVVSADLHAMMAREAAR